MVSHAFASHSSWFLGFQTQLGLTPLARASQAFALRLQDTTGCPGFAAHRGQTVGLLSMHN